MVKRGRKKGIKNLKLVRGRKVNVHGLRIKQSEIDYIRRLEVSINRKVKQYEEHFKEIEEPSYRKKKQHPFVPKREYTNIHGIKTRRRLYERIRQLEEKRKGLLQQKASKIKGFEDLPKYVKEKIKRDTKELEKIRVEEKERVAKIKKQKMDGVIQPKPKGVAPELPDDISPRPVAWVKKNTIYRQNMIKAIKDVFPDDYANELIDMLNSLTEEQFFYYYMSNIEMISYIYHDPALVKAKYEELMDGLLEASLQ